MSNSRREFLKLGALFVPVIAAPRVAYSFLWERQPEVMLSRGSVDATWWTISDMAGRVIYEGVSPPSLILDGHVYCSVRYGARSRAAAQ